MKLRTSSTRENKTYTQAPMEICACILGRRQILAVTTTTLRILECVHLLRSTLFSLVMLWHHIVQQSRSVNVAAPNWWYASAENVFDFCLRQEYDQTFYPRLALIFIMIVAALVGLASVCITHIGKPLRVSASSRTRVRFVAAVGLIPDSRKYV